MVKTVVSVDPKKLPWEQETPVHNRWHPDSTCAVSIYPSPRFMRVLHCHDSLFLCSLTVPSVATVQEGEVFRVECIDWTGGQIKNDDNSDDVKNVDLSQV